MTPTPPTLEETIRTIAREEAEKLLLQQAALHGDTPAAMRQKAGMSPVQLAETAGVSYETVRRVECGQFSSSAKMERTFTALAAVLGVLVANYQAAAERMQERNGFARKARERRTA